jgi:HPt (histidine-containing phosphotransfer) domain-containing protein
MADLVEIFLGKLPDYRQRVHDAAAAGDFARLARYAHDLTAVGGGYGYPMLTLLAQHLESAAQARNTSDVAALAARFERLTRRIEAGASTALATP